MTTNTHHVPVARAGAALPGVATPWASLSGSGACSALTMNFSPIPVTMSGGFAMPWAPAVKTLPLAVTAAGLAIDIRKQYVHKTRVNVGGDGASGPHPEREPA